VTLLSPTFGATGVVIPGLALDWAAAPTGGTADYYEVYMSTDEDPVMNNEFFAETPNSILYIADTDWVLTDNTRYYWTVVGVSIADGAGDFPLPFNFTTAAEVVFDGIVLNGSVNDQDVTLNWLPFYADGTLNWDSGTNANAIGLTDGGTFPVAARFESGSLAPYAGQYVTTLTFFANDAAATYTLKAWTAADGNYTTATEIFSQAAPVAAVGWQNVVVPGIAIPATGSLWLGYETTHAAGTFPAGCDAGPAVDYFGDLIYINGAWNSLHVLAPSLNANWNISGTVTPTAGREVAMLHSKPMTQSVTGQASKAELSAANNNAVAPNTSRYLQGYKVYRNNALITPSPIYALTYADLALPYDTYTYRVEAIYSASTVVSNNWVAVVDPPVPINLPFNETWDSGLFTTNNWIPTGTNWVMSTTGQPGPSAMFNWSPSVTNYSLPLTSDNLNGVGISTINLSFDLALNNYSFAAQNWMAAQIWNPVTSTWNTVATFDSFDYPNFGTTVWGSYSYDISAFAADRVFKLRFLAYGVNSFEINQWYVDNIMVNATPVFLPAPVVTIVADDPDVLVTWDPIPGATWYGVYVSDDPY
ncbi:MAG: hypothetical protein U1B83_10455, partial [Candidatus Cloacimonadaceae bacterium]|nr:hypothetical protein [Candidatus Cloacimonadaceae bacterium]